MHEPDLKKLITGFLLLAVVVSSGTLILSRFLPTNANTEPQTSALSLKNAFLPGGGGNLDSYGITGYQNLTQNLANNLAQSVIKNNLNGPSATGSLTAINVPGDINNIVSQYLDSSSIDLSKIPVPQVDEKRLQIIKNPSKEDVSNYFANLQTVLSGFNSQEFKTLSAQATNGNGESLLESFVLFYSEIKTKLYDLKVPETEINFHKDLVLLIDTPATLFSQNLEADPLMASLVLENSQQILDSTKTDALKELTFIKLSLPKTSGKIETSSQLSFINRVLGVQKAYALFGVGDIVYDPVNWVENFLSETFGGLSYGIDYESWYGKILTEKLKDKLLKMVVNSILNWANGGSSGASPTFVTNWNEFLKTSYVNAADAAIANVTSGICEPFRTQIQLQLYSLYGESAVKNVLKGPTLSDLKTCSLQQSVSNLDDFYGNFGQGGWGGYLALTDFGGNPYGSLYTASQQVGQAAQQAQEADKAKAASGYVGTERCADGSSPVTSGLCSDGSAPEITTPGTNIAQSTSDSLTSAIHRIVNANDWKSLALQLAEFAITKIASSGNKGIRYSNATGSQPADKYASCSGYATGSQDYLDCIHNIDTANSTGGGHGTQSTLLTQAQQALKDAQSALSITQISIDEASSSIQVLTIVASSSCSQATTAQNELTGLKQEYSDLLGKASNLTSQILALTDFITDIQNHDSQDEDYFLTKLDEFQTTFGGAQYFAQAKGDAQVEAQDLQDKLQQSSNLLKACLAQ
jgi:hypothetical protein